MKRLTFICYLLLMLTNSIFSQQEKYGIGLITPVLLIVDLDYGDWSFENIDTYELELYSSPGVLSGSCLINEKNNSNQTLNYYIQDGGGDKAFLQKTKSAFLWYSVKAYVLVYQQIKEGFVQVKMNNKKYWLSIDNLAAFNFKVASWQAYLQQTSLPLETIYNMNIRMEPRATSEKVGLTKINKSDTEAYHSIKVLERFNKQWGEIELSFWQNKKACCKADAPISKLKGWIKLVDDDGSPNLYPQTSCLPE